MTQPSASPPVSSFRPASGWQFDAAPPVAPRSVARDVVSPVAVSLAIVGLLLHGLQGVVTVAPFVELDAAVVLRVLAIWAPTVVLISLGLAVASRSTPLAGTMTVLTVATAALIAVFGVLGSIAWWESLAIVPVLIALVGGALAWIGITTGRAALDLVGLIVVVGAVVLHALLVVVSPLASGRIADVGAFAINGIPVQVLGVAAIVACAVARTSRTAVVATAVVLMVLALGILVGPLVTAVGSVEPNVGVLVVTVVRVVLIALGGALLLRTARR